MGLQLGPSGILQAAGRLQPGPMSMGVCPPCNKRGCLNDQLNLPRSPNGSVLQPRSSPPAPLLNLADHNFCMAIMPRSALQLAAQSEALDKLPAVITDCCCSPLTAETLTAVDVWMQWNRQLFCKSRRAVYCVVLDFTRAAVAVCSLAC